MQTQQLFFQHPQLWISIVVISLAIFVLALVAVVRVLSGRWATRRYQYIVDGAPDALSLVDRHSAPGPLRSALQKARALWL